MGFCTNCGNELNGAKFCTKCGTRNETAGNNQVIEQQEKVVVASDKVTSISKIIVGVIITAVVVGVIVGVIACLRVFLGNSTKEIASTLVDVRYGCKSEKVVKRYKKVFHENYLEEWIDDVYDDEEDWLEKNYEIFSGKVDALKDEYGDKYKYSFNIAREKAYDEGDLRELANRLEDIYDVVPKAAKDITISVRIKGDGEDEKEKIKVTLIKVGSSWYLSDTPEEFYF